MFLARILNLNLDNLSKTLYNNFQIAHLFSEKAMKEPRRCFRLQRAGGWCKPAGKERDNSLRSCPRDERGTYAAALRQMRVEPLASPKGDRIRVVPCGIVRLAPAKSRCARRFSISPFPWGMAAGGTDEGSARRREFTQTGRI